MRPNQSMPHACDVHVRARRMLVKHLDIQPYKKSVPAQLLATLLLLAAFSHTSLFCACQLYPHAPAYQSVRNALHATLPRRCRSLRELLLAALHEALPDHLRRVPQIMVVDLHQRPFYGRNNVKGTTKRQRKKSTKKSFTYATLSVLSPTGRFTAGLLATYPTMRLTTIVSELLQQAAAAGLSVAYLLMDKEFAAAEVLTWLQKKRVAFLVPAQRHGETVAMGNRRFFSEQTAPGWYDYTWQTRLRKWDFKNRKRRQRGVLAVKVQVCVARHHGKKPRLVYYSHGLVGWSVGQVKNTYRRRFGIEATYRQLGQCLARTSTTNERWRLLLVGVALLILNLWAWLHSEVYSQGPLGARQLHLSRLRLAILLLGLILSLLLEGPFDQPARTQMTLHQLLDAWFGT
jgi:Transposase DDE domain